MKKPVRAGMVSIGFCRSRRPPPCCFLHRSSLL
uniref:Uncharacterized protein n=1 Tax=Nymphaea colorata TaxID=210225 RepID=A0A5K0W2Y7_9MAGN